MIVCAIQESTLSRVAVVLNFVIPFYTVEECVAKADVIFAVDASGSVGSVNYEKTKEFLVSVTGKLNVSVC